MNILTQINQAEDKFIEKTGSIPEVLYIGTIQRDALTDQFSTSQFLINSKPYLGFEKVIQVNQIDFLKVGI